MSVIEAVASRFSATCETGGDRKSAYLLVAKKRVAVDVIAMELPKNGARFKRPRLRFDKVVMRLMAELKTRLASVVPSGETAIVTVSAPIRLPAKTAAALEETLRTRIARGSARDIKEELHGIRFVCAS